MTHTTALIVGLGTSAKRTVTLFERYREAGLRREVAEDLLAPVRALVHTLVVDTDTANPETPPSGDPHIDEVDRANRFQLRLPPQSQLAGAPELMDYLELPEEHLLLSSAQVAARGCPRISAAYVRYERKRLFETLKRGLTEISEAKERVTVGKVNEVVHVIVVAGLSGGTASGSVRMVCQLIQQALQELGIKERMVSVFTVASGAESALSKERAQANTYAQLMELYADSQRATKSFDWCFVVGGQDGRGRVVRFEKIWQMMAQVLHLLLCTDAGPTIVGRLGDPEQLRVEQEAMHGGGKVFSALGFSRLYLPDLSIYCAARLGCSVLNLQLEEQLGKAVCQQQALENLKELGVLPSGEQRTSGVRRELMAYTDDQGARRALLERVDQSFQQIESQGLSADTSVSLRPSALRQTVERCRELLEENELHFSEGLIRRVNSQVLRGLKRGKYGVASSIQVVDQMLVETKKRMSLLGEHLEIREEKRAAARYQARTLQDRLVAVLNGDHGALVRQLGTGPLNLAAAVAERVHASLEVEVLGLEAERRLLEDLEEHLSCCGALLEGLRARYQEIRDELSRQMDQEASRSHAFEWASGLDLAASPGDFGKMFQRLLLADDESQAVEQVVRQFGGLPATDVGVLRQACAARFLKDANAQKEFLARYPDEPRRESNLRNLVEQANELLEINECRADDPRPDSSNPTARVQWAVLDGASNGVLAPHLRRWLGGETQFCNYGTPRMVDLLTVRAGLSPTAISLLEPCRKAYHKQMLADRKRGSMMSHTGRLEHLLVELLPDEHSLERAAAMGFALEAICNNGTYRFVDGGELGSTPDEARQALLRCHGKLAGIAASFVEDARQPERRSHLVERLLAIRVNQPWLSRAVDELIRELG